jgi:hypothetical protein
VSYEIPIEDLKDAKTLDRLVGNLNKHFIASIVTTKARNILKRLCTAVQALQVLNETSRLESHGISEVLVIDAPYRAIWLASGSSCIGIVASST